MSVDPWGGRERRFHDRRFCCIPACRGKSRCAGRGGDEVVPAVPRKWQELRRKKISHTGLTDLN